MFPEFMFSKKNTEITIIMNKMKKILTVMVIEPTCDII